MLPTAHLIDSIYLKDKSNKRHDQYGGSIENGTSLLIEIVETAARVWGADRIGVRRCATRDVQKTPPPPEWATAIRALCQPCATTGSTVVRLDFDLIERE